MVEVQIARELVTTLMMLAGVIVWPPVTTGPFWLMAALYAVVSIFFDDETPRGIPGIEFLEQPETSDLAAPTGRGL